VVAAAVAACHVLYWKSNSTKEINLSKQKYEHHDFKADSLTLIKQVNAIIDRILGCGDTGSTVRSSTTSSCNTAIVENTLKSYKACGVAPSTHAKMAGLIDCDIIEDRTREFHPQLAGWESGKSILERRCLAQFHMDMWANQPKRVFVHSCEKEPLGRRARTSVS